ncbi:MAG: pyrroline-5-carboxylate reductase [Proteobacteria bacterium]|nr:pyrroline-5-carboxylate reductase [Pseudomonadota bacterium]
MESNSIGFIGAGNMANSLIQGLLAKTVSPDLIWASDIDERKLQQLADECGINTASSQQVAESVDVIVLAVKPQSMEDACQQLVTTLAERSPLIVSIAAGITVTRLQHWLGSDTAIVRCMPNTPALIGKGASGLFANNFVSDSQKQLAEQIMATVGLSLWVDSESDIDIVTALSGSGPAYFFLFMEAMQDAAKKMGLSEELARKLTYQTAAGAAELAMRSEDNTDELRRKVTSPGGTTERAINKFETGGLRELVASALQAARDRSIELSDEFGNK